MPKLGLFHESAKLYSEMLAAALLALIIFAGYLATIAPDIQWLDSGELQASAVLLGIGHPPGEPLYAIVCHAMRFVPIGSLAFRVTLASSLCGVIAYLVVYGILIKISILIKKELNWGDRLTALCLTLFLAFSYGTWVQTTRSEVYSLNILLTAIITLLTLFALSAVLDAPKHKIIEPCRHNAFIRIICLISFILGLASGNHSLLIALMAPPIALFVILPRLSNIRLKGIIFCLLFFLFGLTIYLYLPLRAATSPPVNWGNPESMERMFWVISGKMFQKSFDITMGKLMLNLGETVFILMAQVTLMFFFLGILGLFLIIRRNLLLGGFLISALAFNLISVVTQDVFIGTNPDLLGYISFSVVILVIGIHWSFAEGYRLLELGGKAQIAKVAALVACLAIISTTLAGLTDNIKDVNRGNHYSANDYGKAVLEMVSHDSFLVTSNIGTLFTTWYLQYVERYREDVIVIHKPFLRFEWYVENMKTKHPGMSRISYQNINSLDDLIPLLKDRPIFIELGLGIKDNLIPNLSPHGLIFKYNQREKPLEKENLGRQKSRFITLGPKLTANKNDVEPLKMIYWNHYCHGIFYAKRKQYDQARWEFESCLAITPNAKDIKALTHQLEVESNTGRQGVWQFGQQRTSR